MREIKKKFLNLSGGDQNRTLEIEYDSEKNMTTMSERLLFVNQKFITCFQHRNQMTIVGNDLKLDSIEHFSTIFFSAVSLKSGSYFTVADK